MTRVLFILRKKIWGTAPRSTARCYFERLLTYKSTLDTGLMPQTPQTEVGVRPEPPPTHPSGGLGWNRQQPGAGGKPRALPRPQRPLVRAEPPGGPAEAASASLPAAPLGRRPAGAEVRRCRRRYGVTGAGRGRGAGSGTGGPPGPAAAPRANGFPRAEVGQGPARPRGLAPPGLRSGGEGARPGAAVAAGRERPWGGPGAAGGGRGLAGHRGRLRARRGEGAGRCGRQPRGLRSAGVAPWQRVTGGESPPRAPSARPLRGSGGCRWRLSTQMLEEKKVVKVTCSEAAAPCTLHHRAGAWRHC